MTEPDPRDVPLADLDAKGMDRVGLAETLREMNGAVAAMVARMRSLGDALVTGVSDDKQVTVRTTRSGRLAEVSLAEAAMRRQDLVALGEQIARTIRDTQRRGRAEYERALADLQPPEFVITDRGPRLKPGTAL
jgi:hypothetical protein